MIHDALKALRIHVHRSMTPNRKPRYSFGGRLPLIRQRLQIRYSRLLFFTVIIVPAALLAYTDSESLSKPVRPHIKEDAYTYIIPRNHPLINGNRSKIYDNIKLFKLIFE